MYTSFKITEFLIIQPLPMYDLLKRTEFSTVPFMIQPLAISEFDTLAPGLYFAGGKSSTLEYTPGYSTKK